MKSSRIEVHNPQPSDSDATRHALRGEVLSFQRFDAEKLKTSVQKVEEINRWRRDHMTVPERSQRDGEGWNSSP